MEREYLLMLFSLPANGIQLFFFIHCFQHVYHLGNSMLAIWVYYLNHPWRCIDKGSESFNDTEIMEQSGMVQWLWVEACDHEIGVRFPMPTVISDQVAGWQSSQLGPCGMGLQKGKFHSVFVHPTHSLKIPLPLCKELWLILAAGRVLGAV